MKLFLDTSIFIDVLRSNKIDSSISLFKKIAEGNSGFASVITVAELSVGAYRSPRKDALDMTFKLVSVVNVVDLTSDFAIEGGRIYSELSREGVEIELNDCLIAATAISLGVKRIVTRDVNHFNRIKGVEAVIPEELGF